MRLKIALGIAVIFCFAEARSLFPFLEYYVNYEYISEVLCINKDKSVVSCNGKCYMNQQLKKVQESEKKDKQKHLVDQVRTPMFICDPVFSEILFNDSISKKHKVFYQFSIKDSTISPPTPPPKC